MELLACTSYLHARNSKVRWNNGLCQVLKQGVVPWNHAWAYFLRLSATACAKKSCEQGCRRACSLKQQFMEMFAPTNPVLKSRPRPRCWVQGSPAKFLVNMISFHVILIVAGSSSSWTLEELLPWILNHASWNTKGASQAGKQEGLLDPRSALASEIFVAADKLPLLQLAN